MNILSKRAIGAAIALAFSSFSLIGTAHAGGQLIFDSGLEQGPPIWVDSGWVIQTGLFPGGAVNVNGNHYADLSHLGDKLSQTVWIPANATKVTLRFQFRGIGPKNGIAKLDPDVLDVSVSSVRDGVTLNQDVVNFSSANNGQALVAAFDITNKVLTGGQVTLQFAAFPGANSTEFLVDNVYIDWN